MACVLMSLCTRPQSSLLVVAMSCSNYNKVYKWINTQGEYKRERKSSTKQVGNSKYIKSKKINHSPSLSSRWLPPQSHLSFEDSIPWWDCSGGTLQAPTPSLVWGCLPWCHTSEVVHGYQKPWFRITLRSAICGGLNSFGFKNLGISVWGCKPLGNFTINHIALENEPCNIISWIRFKIDDNVLTEYNIWRKTPSYTLVLIAYINRLSMFHSKWHWPNFAIDAIEGSQGPHSFAWWPNADDFGEQK